MPEFTAVPQLRPSTAAQPNRVAEIAAWLAAAQDSPQAKPLQRPRAIVFEALMPTLYPLSTVQKPQSTPSAMQIGGAIISSALRSGQERASTSSNAAQSPPARLRLPLCPGRCSTHRPMVERSIRALICSSRLICRLAVAAELADYEPVAIVGTNTLASGITDAMWRLRVRDRCPRTRGGGRQPSFPSLRRSGLSRGHARRSCFRPSAPLSGGAHARKR